MSKKDILTADQAEFLEAARKTVKIDGRETVIPLCRPIGLCPTLTGTLAGLIRRGWLEWRNANFLYTTDAGSEALAKHYAEKARQP